MADTKANKLKVVILGSGWGVKVQIPAFKMIEGLEVVGLWVRNQEKIDEFRQKLQMNVTTDWKALVSQPEVDLVSIVSPPHLHKEMVLFALQANKHVLCEKPFALNLAEAKEMLTTSQKHPNLVHWIDHELRFLDVFKQMKAAILKYGKILSVSCNGTLQLDPNHNFYWWDDESLGGGLLGAVGSHFIDLIHWLTGLKITSVSAQLGSQIKTSKDGKTITSDDWFLLNVRIGDDIPGIFHHINAGTGISTWHNIQIRTEQANIFFEVNPTKAVLPQYSVIFNDGRVVESFTETSPPVNIIGGIFGKGTIEIGKEIERVMRSKDPGEGKKVGAATFDDGVYIQAVMDAAKQSNRTNAVFVPVICD